MRFRAIRRRPVAVFCACLGGVFGALGVAASEAGIQVPLSDEVGHPTFVSPHSEPIVINGRYLYVANTPADTVDVIDTRNRKVVIRISVGIDPVGLAIRPDRREVWVSNHVSDTVSVIDTNKRSGTFHQVIATVQDVDPDTFQTRFDEPVGIAFASNSKAYVALGPDNRVAIIDVKERAVTGHLPIPAQDPRALFVQGDRLYVIAFESNNQSQLSGCREEDIDGETCTFDAVEHVFTNNNVLSRNYDADIVKNDKLPDRDLFIFSTVSDRLLRTVTDVGTLLYGLTVDSQGRVFVAQTDARNVDNGRAGTLGHGLLEMENRAFLNQVTRIDCPSGCRQPQRFDLEPLPPEHPAPGEALATPFAIEVSRDDSTLVVTAAGSDKVFTMDADTGRVLGSVRVGAAPRGIALISDRNGAPYRAYVLNAVGNTVSLLNVADPAQPRVMETVTLDDPTHPEVKRGRIAFNDADASSTGTFSCESCHPDGHTDQLIWVLDTPACSGDPRDECMPQVPPRLTMPVRGLRDTQPYHWDGIPGDPYGGINTAFIDQDQAPNCSVEAPESCTRHLVDGSMATTMCDLTSCPTNDEGKLGLLDAEDRDALATFILNIPYPPAQERRFDNVLSQSARNGYFEFSFINDSSGRTTGAQTCGACHKMPFWVSTNTPGTGMEAPTWRGAYDRWMVTPQARLNIIDLMEIVNMDRSFPERDIWLMAGASPDIWQMVLEGSTGMSGSFGRQVTLHGAEAGSAMDLKIIRALERSASEGAIHLHVDGVRETSTGKTIPVALKYVEGVYRGRDGRGVWGRGRMIKEVQTGRMVVTFTGRAGKNVDADHPQPGLWPIERIDDDIQPIGQQTRNIHVPFLTATRLRINARHVQEEPSIFVDGRRVEGTVRCAAGKLPNCDDEIVVVRLEEAPAVGGLHFLQLQNADGLFSNDMMFFSENNPLRPRSGNLITSGGTFTNNQFDEFLGDRATFGNWNEVTLAGSVSASNGVLNINVDEAREQPWHVQISHAVLLVGGQEYTLCYRARADAPREMTAYLDANLDTWANVSGGQFRSDLTRSYQRFQHTFTIAETDLFGRVAFDFAQSDANVRIDDIGLYEGDSCGNPRPVTPRF